MARKHRVDFQYQLGRCCLASILGGHFGRYGKSLGRLDCLNGIPVLKISGADKGEGRESENYGEGRRYPVSGERCRYPGP